MAQSGFYPINPDAGSVLQADATDTVAQAFIAHYAPGVVAAASATGVHAAVALTTAVQTVTTAITNPVVPRNVTVKGNAGGIAGSVVITGTDMADAALTESIALNGSSEVVGLKAFKTVTSIELPVYTNGGSDTVSVGIGSKIGLPFKLALNTVHQAFLGGTLEGTAPTVTTSSTVLASNTATLNSSLNATAVDLFIIVP